jgi:dipeptidyl aminopeptidase/acylaminoacyl peptidase
VGLHRFDSRNSQDTLLARVARGDVDGGVSPDRTLLAVGYTGADSSRVLLIPLPAGAPHPLHAVSRAYSYSLDWSLDGGALGAGYYTARGQGDVVTISPDGTRRSTGCAASKIVHRWLPIGLVVGDGRNHYVVEPRGCRTIATINGTGRREITYSPDGTKFFYVRTARLRDPRGRTSNVTELRVADLGGGNDFKVVGDTYDPQHARWSPDGKHIALDVASPQTRGLRHVALFNLAAQRVQFFQSQSSAGTPRDSDPHWAPDGTRIVHDRRYGGSGGSGGSGGRGGSGGSEKIVRTLALDPGAVQVAPAVVMSGEIGTTWGWVNNSQVLVTSERWVKLVNVDGGAEYALPPARRVIYVAVVR